MVFFKIVENKPFWYFFFRKWLVLIFSYSYYRRFHVRNKQNIPPEGTPILMLSNHQNGLIDALGILFAMPLRYKVVFLARADIFKKKLTAKILNFCKIMPIYRQRDGRDQLGENAAIFDESAKLIDMGYPVTMFPEGQHQEGHYLGTVKKGFARIAFDAAERNGFPDNMVILPVGNHYSDYFASRSSLCITFGTPIRLSEYYALYRENPPKAMAVLADDVQTAIRGLMLDLPSGEHYPLYDELRAVVRNSISRKQGLRLGYLPDQLAADRIFARRISETEPEKMAGIREQAASYIKGLKTCGLRTEDVERPVSFPALVGRLLLLLAGFPLALYGICFTGLPVCLGRRQAEKTALRIRNKMLQSSFDFVITQLIMSAAFYLVYIVLYWIFFDSWLVFAGLLVSWVLSRMFWQDYLHYARRSLSRFRSFFRKKDVAELRPCRESLARWATDF